MLCDSESLRGEIQHLNCIFLQNGYSKNYIRRALHPKQKPQTKDEKPVGVALLPYQQTITNKISRLLAKHNIRTIHIPKKKNIHMLRPIKDDLGLKVLGIYRIPCECGKVYVGQTGRSVEARCKEHMRHITLVENMCIYFKYVSSDFLLFLDESWSNLIDGSTWVTYQLLPTLLSLLLKSNSWHSIM
jgi:hypothetical protein